MPLITCSETERAAAVPKVAEGVTPALELIMVRNDSSEGGALSDISCTLPQLHFVFIPEAIAIIIDFFRISPSSPARSSERDPLFRQPRAGNESTDGGGTSDGGEAVTTANRSASAIEWTSCFRLRVTTLSLQLEEVGLEGPLCLLSVNTIECQVEETHQCRRISGTVGFIVVCDLTDDGQHTRAAGLCWCSLCFVNFSSF